MNSTASVVPAAAPSTGDDLDMAELLDTLFQRMWLILAITLLAIAAGVAFAVLSTPIYRADALIQVERPKSTTLSSIEAAAEALGGGDSPISGEIEILRSREVLMQAIESTQADITVRVANRFPLIGEWMARRHAGRPGLAEPLLGLEGYAWGGEDLKLAQFDVPDQAYGTTFLVKVGKAGFILTDAEGRELASGPLQQTVAFQTTGGMGRIAVASLQANENTIFNISRMAPIAAYRHIRDRLSVEEAALMSNILRISYEDPDMRFASALVNAIASGYLKQNVERRSAEASQSLQFLDTQLPTIKHQVSQAEEALNKYRQSTNTFSVDSTVGSLLGQSVDAEKRRLELELQREALLDRYQPNHPSVRVVDEQLATATRELEKLNKEVNTLPAAQRDLLRLQRDADVSSQLYIALLNNAEQLRVAKAGTVGNVRVIDFAISDTDPVAPNKPMVVAIAGVLGLALGIAVALIARLMRPTVRDADEAERSTGMAVYVTVPESAQQQRLLAKRQRLSRLGTTAAGASRLLAVTHPEDPAIESLRSLRTGLAFALMGARDRNIAITGPTAAVGKTFIAANLSVLLASAGKRILLIDADLRRPRLGYYFGYNKVAGLSNVLAGTAKLDEVLLKSTQEGLVLDVLPAGLIPPNPGELLLSEGFSQLLADMQERYDHVVLDTAPVLPVADTLAIIQHVSTVFMVGRAEQSTARELRDASRKLASVGQRPKGVIFNGVKLSRMGYGYKYAYGYKAG